MNSCTDLTRRSKSIETLRWIGVFPAACLGSFAVRQFIGIIGRTITSVGASSPSGDVGYNLLLVLFYAPKEVAFVIAGTVMAPRRRLITAVVLSVIGILLSLVIHILGQANPGTLNYTHFAAESAGIVLGLGLVFYHQKSRRKNS